MLVVGAPCAPTHLPAPGGLMGVPDPVHTRLPAPGASSRPPTPSPSLHLQTHFPRRRKSHQQARGRDVRCNEQQQQQQQQQSPYPNAQCSHQCQGFHATRGNTPTSWGGSSSSTKYPNDSSRPPTPSFPPYDVGTLHFVACGRPWLLFKAHAFVVYNPCGI